MPLFVKNTETQLVVSQKSEQVEAKLGKKHSFSSTFSAD